MVSQSSWPGKIGSNDPPKCDVSAYQSLKDHAQWCDNPHDQTDHTI